MNLFEDLVDLDGVGFTPLLPLFLITLGDALLGLTGLFSGLSGSFGGHDVKYVRVNPSIRHEKRKRL